MLRRRLILVGFGLTLLYWIIETADDAFLFHMGSFSQRLLPLDPNEIWMRITVCCLFIGFAAYVNHVTSIMSRLHGVQVALQKQLEHSLASALNGHIRACSWCKRVEDKTDSWIPVELYVEKRTTAQFTHGICPCCLKTKFHERAGLEA